MIDDPEKLLVRFVHSCNLPNKGNHQLFASQYHIVGSKGKVKYAIVGRRYNAMFVGNGDPQRSSSHNASSISHIEMRRGIYR
jgi:hypothetical protein